MQGIDGLLREVSAPLNRYREREQRINAVRFVHLFFATFDFAILLIADPFAFSKAHVATYKFAKPC